MKKITDKELERQLFQALSTPPEEGLSFDFSAKLRLNLQKKLQRENKLRFYGIWGIVFVLVMTALFFSLLFIDRAYNTQVIQAIVEHKWIFIISFPVLFIIQYVDHTSIKDRQLKKHYEPKNSF